MMAGRTEAMLVPGLRAFLERHRDLPMAVASNAEPENVDFVLEETGLRPYFQAVVDGHQVKTPNPIPTSTCVRRNCWECEPARLRCFRGFPFRRGGGGGGGDDRNRNTYHLTLTCLERS